MSYFRERHLRELLFKPNASFNWELEQGNFHETGLTTVTYEHRTLIINSKQQWSIPETQIQSSLPEAQKLLKHLGPKKMYMTPNKNENHESKEEIRVYLQNMWEI